MFRASFIKTGRGGEGGEGGGNTTAEGAGTGCKEGRVTRDRCPCLFEDVT